MVVCYGSLGGFLRVLLGAVGFACFTLVVCVCWGGLIRFGCVGVDLLLFLFVLCG